MYSNDNKMKWESEAHELVREVHRLREDNKTDRQAIKILLESLQSFIPFIGDARARTAAMSIITTAKIVGYIK